MTVSSSQHQHQQQQPISAASSVASSVAKTRLHGPQSGASQSTTGSSGQSQQQQLALPPHLSSNSSIIFQQVKQTQASLARLSRVHQQLQQQSNQSSKQNVVDSASSHVPSVTQQSQATRSTTFVDCLIRRFKDCFSEDFCTVPVFVVGNLSPGSDGTHLILPPCISLGRQNISRFSSPKNLRLMNSIRESCKSVEELDLGGNKLTDLIEIYKILQCTPNLRFLNLSENDLSRTSPVAMASSCYGLSSTSSQSSSSPSAAAQQPWSSPGLSQQRTCLAPINQNYQPMGTRRHSSLGQASASAASASSNVNNDARRVAGSRLSEARRLTAAAAVAQSKKTSPAVANKLANSANVNRSSLSRSAISGSSRNLNSSNQSCASHDKVLNPRLTALGKRQVGATSTMNLVRSLSSLSAKDVRSASSSLSRLSTHRTASRGDTKNLVCPRQSTIQSVGPRSMVSASSSDLASSESKDAGNKATSVARKLFAEPIEENDDIDMTNNEQQALVAPSSSSYAPQNLTSTSTATTSTAPSANHQKALSIQTGSGTSKSSTLSSTTPYSGSQNYSSYRRTFESIKALALNNTGCQWRVVCSILSRMPNLEELHLSLNNYERIDLDPNDFKHSSLKRLYLCNNPKLTNWEELDKLLIAFPSLEALSIADCSISQIPENLDRAREWRKICGLNITGWPIKEWPVVERLNQLPSLIDLKCRNLEVLNSIDEPRHHLIARLPKLQRLNGSEIEEREHAEKAFLRFFISNSHLERPSRFHELIQIHGDVVPEVDVDVDLSPPSHANVRVIYLNRNHYRKENEDEILMSEDFLMKLMNNVDSSNTSSKQQLDCIDSNVEMSDQSNDNCATDKPMRLFKDDGQEVVAIDIDLRQSVRKFKTSLASLFGLNSQDLILYYIDHEMVGLLGPELIKHNQKKLWNYNVQNGDQFIVEER